MATQPRSGWAIYHGDLPTNKTGGGGSIALTGIYGTCSEFTHDVP